MSDQAAREMTAEEWADKLVGASKEDCVVAIRSAIARGHRNGLSTMRAAADHFEVAYRYAVNASKPGADAADLLASAETFATIGYDELRKTLS